MTERYFSNEPIQTDRVHLTGPEAHHLLHVMRAKVGTRVVLFDGTGWEFEAELIRSARQHAELLIRSRTYVDRELPVQLVLGVAMPKGDRQKWLVEKAVELGVSRLVPVVAARSMAQPGPEIRNRLRRTVIEASKQSERNELMEISSPLEWDHWLSSFQDADLRWVAHSRLEHGSGPSSPTHSLEPTPSNVPTSDLPEVRPEPGKPRKVWAVAVGPEGGWTETELEAARSAGWTLVGLGPRILRTETAALALAALLATGWESSLRRPRSAC